MNTSNKDTQNRKFRGGEKRKGPKVGIRVRSEAEAEARGHLQVLGLEFRLDELTLSDAICIEISKKALGLVKHVHYTEPMPKGCAVYIHEMAWAPDLGNWIKGYESVSKPYWFPKAFLRDLRDLQNDLDALSQLMQAKAAG